MKRRQVLLGATIVAASIAGCANVQPDWQTTDKHSASTESPTTTVSGSPITPSEVSDEEAKERALSAEEAYLSARLENASCLNNWGTTPSVADKKATVVNRTAVGVVVDVFHRIGTRKTGQTQMEVRMRDTPSP